MIHPKISVIITTYNRAILVPRAIHSVLNQTYSNFELHIVDDASEDTTELAVAHFVSENDRVFYCRHDIRKGLSAARNTGIARSNGEYISFLDDDDVYTQESLEKRINLLGHLSEKQKEGLGIIHGGWEDHLVYENRIEYRRPMIMGSIMDYARDNFCWFPVMSATALYPRKVLDSFGGFDENIRSSVEHDIWMTLATKGYNAFAVDESLAITYYTDQKESMCTDVEQRIYGVEGYLKKWIPTYEKLYGRVGAKRFLNDYRIKVFGQLSAQKLICGDLKDSMRLFRHITAQKPWSFLENIRCIWIIVRAVLRKLVPIKIIQWISEKRKEMSNVG